MLLGFTQLLGLQCLPPLGLPFQKLIHQKPQRAELLCSPARPIGLLVTGDGPLLTWDAWQHSIVHYSTLQYITV
jgi:hypothetical protein